MAGDMDFLNDRTRKTGKMADLYEFFAQKILNPKIGGAFNEAAQGYPFEEQGYFSGEGKQPTLKDIKKQKKLWEQYGKGVLKKEAKDEKELQHLADILGVANKAGRSENQSSTAYGGAPFFNQEYTEPIMQGIEGFDDGTDRKRGRVQGVDPRTIPMIYGR